MSDKPMVVKCSSCDKTGTLGSGFNKHSCNEASRLFIPALDKKDKETKDE